MAKNAIYKEANGTVISTITTKSLKELEIPFIPIQQQKYLIDYTNSYLEEKKITENLLELKELEYQYIINKKLSMNRGGKI